MMSFLKNAMKGLSELFNVPDRTHISKKLPPPLPTVKPPKKQKIWECEFIHEDTLAKFKKRVERFDGDPRYGNNFQCYNHNVILDKNGKPRHWYSVFHHWKRID